MLTSKQKLEYALQLKRLHEIMVVKENLYFAQSNSNHNRAVKNLETLQDRIIENRVKNHIDGNVDLINHKPIVDQVMNTALVNQRKGLSKTSNKKIDKLVDKNIKSYQEIMNNRLKLDAKTLDEKIERELQKKKYNNLGDNQLKHQLKEEFKGTTKKRINRIVGDALHTNQCNISFATAQEQGYKYKVWNNGRGKSRVRPWHRAKVISAVELDDKFYIYGSYPAYMMYPGDLEGGAENVANCRCWLSYTNITPSNLKTKGTIKIKDNVQLTKPNTVSTDKNTVSSNKSLRTKIKESISTKVKTVINSVSNKLSDIFKSFKNKLFNKKTISFRENNFESKIHSDNTVIPELEHPEVKNQIEEFIEFTKDSEIENLEVYTLEGKVALEITPGEEHSVDFDEKILKDIVKNGGVISIHNHPAKFNNVHSISDIRLQLKTGIKFNIVSSYTKLYIVATDELTLVERRAMINQLNVFEKRYDKLLKKLTQEEIDNVLSQKLDFYEQQDLIAEIKTNKILELMPLYEHFILRFFEYNKKVNLYVHDLRRYNID